MTIKSVLITKLITTKKGRSAIKATLSLCPTHKYKYILPRHPSMSKDLDLNAYHKLVANNLLILLRGDNPNKPPLPDLEMIKINNFTMGFIVKSDTLK